MSARSDRGNDLSDTGRSSAAQPTSTPISSPPGLRSTTSDLKWYAVQSKPREEVRCRHFLEAKGFETYLPHMEVATVRGFKNVVTTKPLFPGYLFCRFERDESLAHVRWTKGVKKILPASVEPVAVDDEVIAAIKRLEDRDGMVRNKPLKKHDRVRIARGPMKNILGIFDHWTSDQGRVKVLLMFISYQASVELHHSLIERVA